MGAAQVPTYVGMPPKDGTPCHAGACRGGFGRADPGQPRCDRPATSTDHESGFGLTGDAIAAPARWPRHQSMVTPIAHLAAPGVTTAGLFGDSGRSRALPRRHQFHRRLSCLAGFGKWWPGGVGGLPPSRVATKGGTTAPRNGHPGFRVRENAPGLLVVALELDVPASVDHFTVFLSKNDFCQPVR